MSSQSFDRNASQDVSRNQQTFKYPTYQHYYENKVSRVEEHSSPKKLQTTSEKNLTKVEQNLQSPSVNQKKCYKSSLKADLENLKLEVKRIMQRKQGILKSPVEKRLFPNIDRIKSDNVFNCVQTKATEESQDSQSVNSERFTNTGQKGIKEPPQNYDHSKEMEDQNQMLKTELSTLKNLYSNKKQELDDKCHALEQKVVFLKSSLFNSQQGFTSEIATLKAALSKAEKERENQLILATDNEKNQQSPSKISQLILELEDFKEKNLILSEEISVKNMAIAEQQIQKDSLNSEIFKLKQELFQKNQKARTNHQKLQQLLKTSNKNNQLLSQHQTRISELESALQSQKNKQNQHNGFNLASLEKKLQKIRTQYQQKQEQSKIQYQKLQQLNQKLKDDKMLLEQQRKLINDGQKENLTKIEQLNIKITQQSEKANHIEGKYRRLLQKASKTHEESINNLHIEYQSQIMSLSARKQNRSVKNYSENERGLNGNESSPIQEREIRKWKCQYKQLKEKYQRHLKAESQKKHQLKQYYKNYREYKQKSEIYGNKLKLFEKQFEKYLSILTAKENQLLKQQVQLKKITRERSAQKLISDEQISTLVQKNKSLEEKLTEELQKSETESGYRKQIEQRVFNNAPNDESLKEVMQRMKKRLNEQDEKYSKNVKDIKNKETMNTKLKQELREVMENMQKRINDEKSKQIEGLVSAHLTKQFDSFREWKSRSQADNKVLIEANQKLGAEIEEHKKTIFQKQKQITTIHNELTNFQHSYNMKSMELNELIIEKENIVHNFNEQLQDFSVIKTSVENILREEIMRSNQEITSLRMQLATQCIRPFEYKSYHSNFDDILKNHIEENKKLREDIKKKTEEIFRLRDSYSTQRSQYQNLKAQFDITKLKHLSEMKNVEINFQIEIQKVKNELDMSEKKSNLLEQKFKLIIEQNRKKDSFIQTYIVGKKLVQTDKDLVINFIKQYQITVGSSDIVQRLASQTKEIEQIHNYNKALLKEISTLKEKLLQFQAIDEEKVSVFDSKLEMQSANSSDFNEQLPEEANWIDSKAKNMTNSADSKIKKTESLQNFTLMEQQF